METFSNDLGTYSRPPSSGKPFNTPRRSAVDTVSRWELAINESKLLDRRGEWPVKPASFSTSEMMESPLVTHPGRQKTGEKSGWDVTYCSFILMRHLLRRRGDSVTEGVEKAASRHNVCANTPRVACSLPSCNVPNQPFSSSASC